MEGLPKEIIKYIGKFLRPEDLNAFRQTCKSYRECIMRDSLNQDRILLYAQRAMWERRTAAVEYFFEMLSQRYTDDDDEDDSITRDLLAFIIEADCRSALYLFKKHFCKQNGDWMFRLQVKLSELESAIWFSTVSSIDTFKRLNFGFQCLTTGRGGKSVIEKMMILYQFVNTRYFKWAFANDKIWIAVAIIEELQFIEEFQDFSSSRRCSEKLQKLYCHLYAGHANGFAESFRAESLISFIQATGHVHEDACDALAKYGSHHVIEEYCNCEKSLLKFNVNKRALNVEVKSTWTNKRIKF